MKSFHEKHRVGLSKSQRCALNFVIGLLVAFLWSMVVFPRAARADLTPTTIFFYSSETNINNFKSLKMEFDTYLSSLGPYEFQPFQDRETFEEYVRNKPNCLLLLSSWHYANIHQRHHLKALFVGSRNGRKYQKNLLVACGESLTLDVIQAGRIASASSVQHTESILRSIAAARPAPAGFKILTVPKDIDALMALGFGMAKAALTTAHSLEKLQRINPMLSTKLSILAESEEALLLILAVPEDFASEVAPLLSILQEMPATSAGKKNMRMLGLDNWQPFEPSDEAALESERNDK